jgi:hypothetical protein
LAAQDCCFAVGLRFWLATVEERRNFKVVFYRLGISHRYNLSCSVRFAWDIYRSAGTVGKMAALRSIASYFLLLVAGCVHSDGANVSSGSAPKRYTDPGFMWAP